MDVEHGVLAVGTEGGGQQLARVPLPGGGLLLLGQLLSSLPSMCRVVLHGVIPLKCLEGASVARRDLKAQLSCW